MDTHRTVSAPATRYAVFSNLAACETTNIGTPSAPTKVGNFSFYEFAAFGAAKNENGRGLTIKAEVEFSMVQVVAPEHSSATDAHVHFENVRGAVSVQNRPEEGVRELPQGDSVQEIRAGNAGFTINVSKGSSVTLTYVALLEKYPNTYVSVERT